MIGNFLVSLFFSCQYNPGNYYSYKASDFFSLPEVEAKININNIDKTLLEAAIFHATNIVRKEKESALYKMAPSLIEAATQHASHLSKYSYFDHINKRDRTQRTPMLRITKAGGKFKATAENLAKVNVFNLGEKMEYFINDKGQLTDKNGVPLNTHTYKSLAMHVVNGWMHSKGHRENILADYNYLGCGVSDITFTRDNLPEIILIQNFGQQ